MGEDTGQNDRQTNRQTNSHTDTSTDNKGHFAQWSTRANSHFVTIKQ